jgi:hypothetical protein
MLHGIKSRDGNEAVCAFNGKFAAFGGPKKLRCHTESSPELVVIGMFVAPIPVCPLLAAVGLAEGHIVFGMFSPEGFVGFRFTIIPVVIVLVVAIVDPNADLRRGVGRNCERSYKRGA